MNTVATSADFEPDPAERARLDALMTELMEELRRIAHRIRRENRPVDDMGTTVLVNDLYLRLSAPGNGGWNSRGELLTRAARTIRWILTDAARARACEKRGGPLEVEALDPVLDQYEGRQGDGTVKTDLLDLNAALDRLAREHPKIATIVEMRYFLSLPSAEIAEVLGLTQRRVQGLLERAHRYLKALMDREPPPLNDQE